MQNNNPGNGASTPAQKPVKKRGPQGPRTTAVSAQARRVATAILEVMAGARVPSDAAKSLSISLPRYYLLETRALNGFISACEPRPLGRVRSTESELNAAKTQVQRLQQECARYAALVRTAQRTIGLAAPLPPKPTAGDGGKKHRKRKPTVRALKAVEMLKISSGETQAGSAGEQPAQG